MMWKIGGAAATAGMSLAQVKKVPKQAVYNTRSMGVEGLSLHNTGYRKAWFYIGGRRDGDWDWPSW